MGGPSAHTRKDVYRVDPDKARMAFILGETLPLHRTHYKNSKSHDVRKDGDWLILTMYGEHDVAKRNLQTGEIFFDHCGWPSMQTQRVLEPLVKHFLSHISLHWKCAPRGQSRTTDSELYLIAKNHGRLDLPATITPKGKGIVEIHYGEDESLLYDIVNGRPV